MKRGLRRNLQVYDDAMSGYVSIPRGIGITPAQMQVFEKYVAECDLETLISESLKSTRSDNNE